MAFRDFIKIFYHRSEKQSDPHATEQGPEADKLGLTVEKDSQKIPPSFGDVVEISFHSLLPAEVGLIAEGVVITVYSLHIIQGYIGAHVVFCGVNNLAPANYETVKRSPYGDSAGKFDVVSP